MILLFVDMKISAFYVLPRIALSSEIFRWSQNCTADISGASMSIDNLAQAENVATFIPAVCDGKFRYLMNTLFLPKCCYIVQNHVIHTSSIARIKYTDYYEKTGSRSI